MNKKIEKRNNRIKFVLFYLKKISCQSNQFLQVQGNSIN